MTSLQRSVDRGLEIRATIQQLQDELSTIEECLRHAALAGEQVELTDPDREGRQFLAKGTESVVPVVLTADLVAQTFADGSPVHARLKDVAGEKLGQFYRAVTTWKMLAKNGKAFRLEAHASLGDKDGPAFITAALARDKNGIPKSQIKVEWDRAEEIKP